MKKILVFLSFLLCLTSGCSFKMEVLTPAPTQIAATEVIQSKESALASPSVNPAIPLVGFTPTTTGPIVFGAYMSKDQDDVSGMSIFPAGTKQIFAHWDYQNMREGLTIKREWFLNDQPWLTREDPWDFSKNGAFGWISDVSIYDFDAGLPSGRYKLIVSIDGVAQPIGERIIEGTAQPYLEFEILPPIEATSPSGQWKAISLLDRVVVTDANGNQSDLVIGREIVSVTWLDDRHLLFVDRDRSGQFSDLLVGARDTLWLLDIISRESWSLYASDTALGSTGGLYPSPDGKYIAGIEGTGFGDACFLDAKVIFFEVENEHKSVKVTRQDQFAGMPVLAEQILYPTAVGTWKSNTQYSIYLNRTCSMDDTLLGFYLFDLPSNTVMREPTSSALLNVGDLGWGDVHGFVTDAVTGNAIPNATVTCQHSSYTSPSPCTGSVITSAVGLFLFERVFFHDTDTIKLTVTAPEYESQEYTQSSFTRNDMFVNFTLKPLP